MLASVLGTIVTVYGLTAGGSSLLQARRMARRGTSEDVSLSFLGMYVAGYALWLVYGLTSGSLPLIIVDVVGVLSGTCTLALALSLRPRRPTEPAAGLALAASARRMQVAGSDPRMAPTVRAVLLRRIATAACACFTAGVHLRFWFAGVRTTR